MPRYHVAALLSLTVLTACTSPAISAPAAVFDLQAARRADDLGLESRPIPSPNAQTVRAEEVAFSSTEWGDDGRPHSIRIKGFLAERVAPGPSRVGVVVAHGLGARADLDVAVELARNLDVTALAISAPGLGGSEGRAVTFDDPRPLFAGGDVRASWLYAYVHAVLRAVTVLQHRAGVDKLVVTGVSMGGIASFIAGGVDDRLAGVFPMNASGGLVEAALGGSWLGSLARAARGRPLGEDEEAQARLNALDPLAFSRQHGVLFMLAGAQDEFFPLPQVVATYDAIRAPYKRLALIPDFDHEWYFAHGCTAAQACRCPEGARAPYCGKQASYNRHDEVLARWAVNMRALLALVQGEGTAVAPPQVERRGDELVVSVAGPAPRVVRLAVSDNGGYTYGQFRLQRGADGDYHHPAAGLPAGAIAIAEAELASGDVVSSVPRVPPDFHPIIRPFGPP
jgi:dienelactone hydrolase